MNGRKQKHADIFRGMIVFLAILITGIIVYGGVCAARIDDAAKADSCRGKYYMSYRIQYGDTLWGIARQYMNENYASTEEYIKEIMAINHLAGDRITAGNYLIVVYYPQDTKKYTSEP